MVAPPPATDPAGAPPGFRPWRVPALGVVTTIWAGLLLAWAYFSYTHTPTLVSLGGDSAVYALTARHFQAVVAGVPDPVAALAAANSVYPPLHPLLLALAGAGRGVSDSWLAGNWLVTTELWLALAVFHLWLLRRGHHWAVALAGTLALGLMPGVWQPAVLLLSENLFLLLSLAALAWFEPTAGARRLVMTPRGAAVVVPWHVRAGPWPGLACVALATLTRTAGVALLAGVAAAWAWSRVAPGLAGRAPLADRPMRQALVGLLLAALPLGLWNVVHRPAEPYTASLVRAYGQDQGLVSALAARAGDEARALAEAWPELFELAPSLAWLAWVVAGLGLVGLIGRAVRGRADGWYALAYLAMILLWPFPAEAERFLLVILPLVWAAALDGPATLAAALRALRPGLIDERANADPLLRTGPAGLLAGGLLLALAPGAVVALQQGFAVRAPAGQPVFPEDWRHRPAWYWRASLAERVARVRAEDDTRDLHAALARWVPAGACVLSPKPALSMLFGHRPAWGLPRPELDDAAFQAALRQRACRYVVVMAAGTPTYPPQYPLARLPGIDADRFLPSADMPLALLVTLPPFNPPPP